VVGLAPKGPAEKAGVKQGDIVVDVAGAPVGALPDFFRTLWQVGPAGVDVPLTLWREGKTQNVTVTSTDRSRLLKSPRLH
jgi:S1-C subfamily serine protease